VCTRSGAPAIAQAASVSLCGGYRLRRAPAQTAPSGPLRRGVEILCQPQVVGIGEFPRSRCWRGCFSRQNDLYDRWWVERDFKLLWTPVILKMSR